MDWKLVLAAFTAVFVAELGDKTQLATMAMAGSASSKWSVFLGAATALVATSAIGVLVGGALSQVVPEIWIKRAAGALFIVMGVLYLLSKPEA